MTIVDLSLNLGSLKKLSFVCSKTGLYKTGGIGRPVIGCVAARDDSPGVNVFEANSVRKQVRHLMAVEDT